MGNKGDHLLLKHYERCLECDAVRLTVTPKRQPREWIETTKDQSATADRNPRLAQAVFQPRKAEYALRDNPALNLGGSSGYRSAPRIEIPMEIRTDLGVMLTTSGIGTAE